MAYYDKLLGWMSFTRVLVICFVLSMILVLLFTGTISTTGSSFGYVGLITAAGSAMVLFYFYRMAGPIVHKVTLQDQIMSAKEFAQLVYSDISRIYWGSDYIAWTFINRPGIAGARILYVKDVKSTYKEMSKSELERLLRSYEVTMGSGTMRLGTYHVRLPIDVEAFKSGVRRKMDTAHSTFDAGGPPSFLHKFKQQEAILKRIEQGIEQAYDARFFIHVTDIADSREELENLLNAHTENIRNRFRNDMNMEVEVCRDVKLREALQFFRPMALVDDSFTSTGFFRPARVLTFDLIFQNPFVTRRMPPLEDLLYGIEIGQIKGSGIPVSWNPAKVPSFHGLIIGPVGCLVGDERVVLGNGAVEKICDLGSRHLESINVKLRTGREGGETATATVFHKYPPQPILEIVTESGRSLKGTYNHPVLVATNDPIDNNKMVEVWKQLDEIIVGDKVRIVQGFRSTIQGKYKTGWTAPKTKHRSFSIKVPSVIDENLAALMGIIIADGDFHRDRTINIYLSSEERDLVSELRKIVSNLFDTSITVTQRKPSVIQVHINRTPICNLLSFLHTKRIPRVIWHSPNSVFASFLRWLFEGDGHVRVKAVGKSNIGYVSKDLELIHDVQFALLRFGIDSRIYLHKYTGCYNLEIYRANDIIKFARKIGFASDEKKEQLNKAVENISSIRRRRHKKITERVVAVRQRPPEPVYDLEIPGVHRFIANGFISHNTGKTTFARSLAVRAYRDLGIRVWAIDPAGDYTELFERMGGVVVDFSDPEHGDKLNLFILYGRDPVQVAKETVEMMGYIAGVRGAERPLLERVIREVYRHFNIDETNPRTWTDEASNEVTFEVLYNYLKARIDRLPPHEATLASSIASKIEYLAVGSYKLSRGTVSLDELFKGAKPVCFRITDPLPPYLKKIIVWIILKQLESLSYIRYNISEDLQLIFIIDEAHEFSRPVQDYEVAGGYIEPPITRFVRMMRKRGVGLWLLSHSPSDFVPPGEKTAVLFETIGSIFMFGSTNEHYLAFCKFTLGLTDDEINDVETGLKWMSRRGEGMLRYFGDPRPIPVRLIPEPAALTGVSEPIILSEEGFETEPANLKEWYEKIVRDQDLTEVRVGRDLELHLAVRKGEEDKWDEVWYSTFQLANEEELQELVEFLNERLRRPNSFRLVHAVVVISPKRDEAFKVGEFIRHRSPIERLLFYSVKGQRSDGVTVYDSACEKCRSKEGRHSDHIRVSEET